ncbi:DUF5959 family protein [Streptomyces sp. NPDC007818]|uniref:DUF5959 family protein n=1 Tax=Streptomyces sp. NPDC007818 TaxID=3364780 RepID=UPI0036CA2C2D
MRVVVIAPVQPIAAASPGRGARTLYGGNAGERTPWGREMEDRERFTLLRLAGRYGGGVAIELDESAAPGIPDTGGELMVHNDFVAGVTRTYVEPYDLARWEHVLDEVEAGRDAVWREHARVAEIGIQLVHREEDQDQITVTVADQQTTRVAINLEVNRGWIEEQRALLDRIRKAWKHVHPTASG